MDQQTELVTLAEASRLLRVTVSTLRSWRLQRRLTFVKLAGGKVLLRMSDIQRLIDASVIPSVAK